MTNAHETTDQAHVTVDAILDRAKRELHEAVQGCANYQAMYEEQKQLADHHRKEAARLQEQSTMLTRDRDYALNEIAAPLRLRIEELRAALLLAEEPLAIYVERDSCDCQECPECGQMPVECSKTDCSKTCNCSECAYCRGEQALAETRALVSPALHGPYHDVDTANLDGGDAA